MVKLERLETNINGSDTLELHMSIVQYYKYHAFSAYQG
jgi:hypothetical protein